MSDGKMSEYSCHNQRLPIVAFSGAAVVKGETGKVLFALRR